jgi:2-polyprenyl-3-methyl-5-hydroxy-6-metoxy-1,4-benzoquinol methylase
LDCARRKGWETFGVELTESNFRHAKEIFGLDVYNADIEDINFETGKFDVITMWDVLEALPVGRTGWTHRKALR